MKTLEELKEEYDKNMFAYPDSVSLYSDGRNEVIWRWIVYNFTPKNSPQMDSNTDTSSKTTKNELTQTASVEEIKEETESDIDYELYEKRTEEVVKAIKNKEVIYISCRDGHTITEEQYYHFVDWSGSVGKPLDTEVEHFIKIELSPPRNAVIDEVLELCRTAPFPDGKGLVEKIKALKTKEIKE